PVTTQRSHSSGVDFFDPFPSVSSSQVLGATTLYNPGSVEAWPVWTITGPASLVTITHADTGEEFVLDTVEEGIEHGVRLEVETVTVTSDPPRVRSEDGSVWTAVLYWSGAVLWALRPALNNVAFQLDGVEDVSTVPV